MIVQFLVDGARDVFAVDGYVVDGHGRWVNVKSHHLPETGFLLEPFKKLGANVTGGSGDRYNLRLLDHPILPSIFENR